MRASQSTSFDGFCGARRRTMILTAALVASGIVGCRGWQTESPPVHLNRNMDIQERGKAYKATPFFADGRYMRTPPAGSVAQGWLKDDDHLALGLVDGQPAAALPAAFVGGEDAVRRGQQRYGIYCAPCHGIGGEGNGTVASRMAVKPPSLHDARIKEMPVGKIYQAILNGVNNGNMGSYAAQIEQNDRWNIILYVRALQRSKDPAVALGGLVAAVGSASDPPEKKGELLYKNKGCNACHSLDGTRILGPSFLALAGRAEKTSKGDIIADDAYLIESMQMPGAQIVDGYPPVMPAVFGTPPAPLTDDEISSLIAFIKTLK